MLYTILKLQSIFSLFYFALKDISINYLDASLSITYKDEPDYLNFSCALFISIHASINDINSSVSILHSLNISLVKNSVLTVIKSLLISSLQILPDIYS